MRSLISTPMSLNTTFDPHAVDVTYQGHYKSPISHRVEIPTSLHSFPPLQIFIKFLQDKTIAAHPELHKYTSISKGFIDYVATAYSSTKEIPASILKNYAIYLTNHKKLKLGSVRSVMGLLIKVLRWGTEQPWFHRLNRSDKNFFLSMISNRPSIPKNQETDDTFPAMSELVPMRSFDDSALLNSLTHFCIGFLTQYQNHREMIMAYPEVHTRIKLLLAEPARDIDWHFRDPNMLDYDAIFNAIVSSGDNTLVERILFSGTKYREQFLSAVATDTLEDLYKKLRTCIRTTGTILPLGNLSETVQYVTFEQLDMRSLLSPCEAEEICLRWLLGSDRIQLSGQEKLLLEDVEVTPTHVTIHYLKIRSGQEERTSTSHRKKTWQYSILEYYTDLRKNFDEQFPKETLRPGKLFQYTNPFARRQNLASISYRPLILACSPKTQMYQDIAAANPEANYFQDYYLSLIRENTKSYELAKQRKKNNTVGEVYADGHTNASLTANVVAQSRAIIDPDTPPTTSPFDRFLRQSVSADATAHTPWTKEFIYKIRSTTVHRLDKRANFADSVGALQESEARKRGKKTDFPHGKDRDY